MEKIVPEKIKIGIVGGYGHETIRVHPNASLAWAHDGYDDRALQKAEAFNHGVAFPSMEEMLEKFQPDIVYVGTVFTRNGPVALEALERGLPVISEKPLATDEKTLARLRQITSAKNLQIIAELAMRWSPAFVKARHLIQSGVIGDPVLIQAQKTYKFGTNRPDFYKKRELFGGIIPWVASHAIDFASSCTGLKYESVSAQHGNRHFPEYAEMEDHAAMLFQMTNGVPCVITADFLRPSGASSHADDRLRVTGTSGVVEVVNHDVTLTTSEGVQNWNCPSTETEGIQRAIAFVDAALGLKVDEISTADSLHITEAALLARMSADLQQANGLHTPLLIRSQP